MTKIYGTDSENIPFRLLFAVVIMQYPEIHMQYKSYILSKVKSYFCKKYFWASEFKLRAQHFDRNENASRFILLNTYIIYKTYKHRTNDCFITQLFINSETIRPSQQILNHVFGFYYLLEVQYIYDTII